MCIKRRFAWQSPRAGAAVRYGRSGFSRTNVSVVPETTHVVLGTDPNVISPRNVGEVLATRVCPWAYWDGDRGRSRVGRQIGERRPGLGDQCARGAARTGNDKRTGLTLDRVMPMKQRLVTYYRAAAARGRRLERKSPGTNK
jgi:hypothetical protein